MTQGGPVCRTPHTYERKLSTSKPRYKGGVELDFSRLSKPTDNSIIEAFNGRFRQQCLNENWFLSRGRCRPDEILAKTLQCGEALQRPC